MVAPQVKGGWENWGDSPLGSWAILSGCQLVTHQGDYTSGQLLLFPVCLVNSHDLYIEYGGRCWVTVCTCIAWEGVGVGGRGWCGGKGLDIWGHYQLTHITQPLAMTWSFTSLCICCVSIQYTWIRIQSTYKRPHGAVPGQSNTQLTYPTM
jgi:hypothetical protein